jgi:translation initiation factor eIF-2B subunit delta
MDDNTFGSFNVSESYLKVLEDYIQKNKSTKIDEFIDEISRVGRELVKQQPNMVAARKRITGTIYYLKRLSKGSKSVAQVKEIAADKIKEIRRQASESVKKIGETGARLILSQSKILTYGYSTNVLKIIEVAQKHKRKFSVYCLEGRPYFDGRAMAEDIARKGIRVTLLTDAAMAWGAQDASMVLTGADRVFETGIVGRTGGLPLAVVSRHFQIPFYTACEMDKILKEIELAVRFYPQDEQRVLEKSKKLLSPLNFSFESIPLEFISKIVCEEGIFDTNEYSSWFLKD